LTVFACIYPVADIICYFYREMNILKAEVTALAESVQKTSLKGVYFEATVNHFECLKKQQIIEFEKARSVIVRKQCEFFNF